MWLPVALFILTLAMRMLVLHRFFESPYFTPDSGDTAFYNEWALRILGGTFTDGQAFFGLPGYAWLLAGIYAIFGYTPYVPGVLQCVVEASTAVVIYGIGRSLFPGSTRGTLTGTAAAVFWVLYLPAQAFSIVLMPTCYVALAFWGLVLWAVRSTADTRSSVWNPWLWMGLIVGATSTLVATIFFVLPILFLAAFRSLRSPQKSLTATAMLVAGVLLGCSPCWIHNYFVAGEPVLLSAHSGINFYVGNNPEATGYPKIPTGLRTDQAGMLKDSVLVAERETGRTLRRVEVSTFWSAKAKKFIGEHPGDWLRLMGLKVRNLFNGYQYDDLSLIALLRSQRIIPIGIGFGSLAVLAIPGALLLSLESRRSLWVSGGVLLYLAALLPVFVTERYRLPAAPGLALLAAGGLAILADLFKARRWAPTGAYLATAVIALFLVRWPVATPEMTALDRYNVGNRLLQAGNLEQATLFLGKANAQAPDSAEINFALGNLALEKGERTEAKAFYRRTLELNPRHSSAYNNLGVLADEEDRTELAKRFFAMSIQCEPDDPKSWYLLARVQAKRHELEEARASASQAVELAPQQPLFRELLESLENPER